MDFLKSGDRQYKFGDKCTFSTKCPCRHGHESKSSLDGRVTKLITHVHTLKTEILRLKEDNCRKSKNQDETGKDKNKTITVKLCDFTKKSRIDLTPISNKTFNYSAYPKKENRDRVLVQRVWKHFHNFG